MAKDAIYIVITFLLVIMAGFLIFDRVSVEEEVEIEEPTVEEVDTREAVTGSFETQIDLVQSVLGWQAEKTILKTHVNTGTLNLSEGSLIFEDGELVGGEFVVDMESLAITSVHGSEPATGGGSSLLKHLSSDDFFAIEDNPEAKLIIKEADSLNSKKFGYKITGDLTIKDITKEITFTAEVYVDEGRIEAVGIVNIDRTEWDIQFGSSSFFDNLGDNVISDVFNVEILLFAPVVEISTPAEE